MERQYRQNSNKDTVKFFIGDEIEHTKFYGIRTLFVVDYAPTKKIIKLANQYNIKHIFLGANHSTFFISQANQLLNLGFYVTIDAELADIKDQLICIDFENENFCLIVRYELPELLINKATSVKFYSTALNRKGIYVIPSELLKKDEYYTDNSLYSDDIIIKDE